NQSVLTTYGGLVFSGVEITGSSGTAVEDGSFGIFGGLLMTMNEKTEVGLELRLADQTALSVYTAFAF
ncbi:MAG: hypothetical protein ACE5F7_09400, partial [Nitrospiria bacterium]